VNAGLLTLTQSIGVLFGANIGTTLTAWIVSLIGFKISIDSLAVPAVGIGFILRIIKWKYKSIGDFLLGFGFLFLGLHYLGNGFESIHDVINFDAISTFKDMGFKAILIGFGTGLVMTILINSSTAAVMIIMTMAFNNIITYEMAVGMILGANIGTTTDGLMAAIGGTTDAKRAALSHVLFNVIGSCWALPLLIPLLKFIDILVPGNPVAEDVAITTHLAMIHTMFKVINTVLFLPFVKPYAALLTFLVKDKKGESGLPVHYRFEHRATTLRDTPELNVLRAEKEIKDMTGIVLSMYTRFSAALISMQEKPLTEEEVIALKNELKTKEEYADEMRDVLTAFLIGCTKEQLNPRTEQRVSRLIMIIADLENMTDDCFSISLILERSITKDHVFKIKELTELIPYVGLVEEFLNFLGKLQLGAILSAEQSVWARDLENRIDKSRDRLRKLGRKRIEAGKDVKTELLFIDLVRRIEKLGDYCFNIITLLQMPPKLRMLQFFKKG
jgi:phosphate:Na+ symporter